MAHIHEKIDWTVEVFIVNNNAVLLRKHDKYNIWLSVGGHIELDEDPTQAALREVKEEVGLEVVLHGNTPPVPHKTSAKEMLTPSFMNRHRINETHEHITMIYFAKSDSRMLIQTEHEVKEETKWFSREELDDAAYALPADVAYYANAALAAVN